MRVGIVANNLYDGGEVAWTKVLINSLLLLENVNRVNIYSFKHFDNFLDEFGQHEKVAVKKTIFNIGPFHGHSLVHRYMINLLKFFSNPIAYKLFEVSLFEKENDLLIFPNMADEALQCRTSYIIVPHDLRHKYKSGRFFFRLKEYIRELAYKKKLDLASCIIAESDYVKRDIVEFYGIDSNKIKIIVSPVMINQKLKIAEKRQIENKYSITGDYLLYPAHLIHMKNHITLIRAIHHIRNTCKVTIPVILVGSKSSDYDKIMETIEDLGLSAQIRYLGFVPEEDLFYLYKFSRGLVMPSLFESVSMPIWEAFALGVPVTSSNVCALPEQVGDAGLIFDPNSVEDMSEKIYSLWTNRELRDDLISRGYRKIEGLTLENYAKYWQNLLGSLNIA